MRNGQVREKDKTEWKVPSLAELAQSHPEGNKQTDGNNRDHHESKHVVHRVHAQAIQIVRELAHHRTIAQARDGGGVQRQHVIDFAGDAECRQKEQDRCCTGQQDSPTHRAPVLDRSHEHIVHPSRWTGGKKMDEQLGVGD
jgi:hypothetical protein